MEEEHEEATFPKFEEYIDKEFKLISQCCSRESCDWPKCSQTNITENNDENDKEDSDIEFSLEDSDISENSSQIESSDLSSSDISGQVLSVEEKINEGQLVVELEKQKKKIDERLKNQKGTLQTKGTVIILRNIPYGFFEPQMKQFFSQFGRVIKINHFRNPKTGKLRPMAFVQFEDPSVARIVADTMDGYIMFSRTLKCYVLENAKASLFTKIKYRKPGHKEHAKHVNRPKSKKVKERRYFNNLEKDQIRKRKIEEAGIDYEPPVRPKPVFSKDLEEETNNE